MLKYLTIGILITFGGTCSAASLTALDLVLKLDSTGFADVSIFDDNDVLIDSFDYLDATDDPWGITAPFDRFAIGDEVPLTAMLSDTNEQLSDCAIGSVSCESSFGRLDGDTFSFGDGAGLTPWGDFFMEGGTKVGDQVSLLTFDGAPSFEFRAGDRSVMWDSYVQNFTVTQTSLVTAPLPGSILFLAAGILGFGVLRRAAGRPN